MTPRSIKIGLADPTHEGGRIQQRSHFKMDALFSAGVGFTRSLLFWAWYEPRRLQ